MLTPSSVDEAPITIVVGPTEQRFYVHSSVLQSSSAFFKAALKQQWSEGQAHEVKLSEDKAHVFGIYAGWLYTGKVNTTLWPYLARLYALGEKIIDSAFQDDVVNVLIARTPEKDTNDGREFPGQRDVARIYRDTPVGSPARRLMLDLYAIHGMPGWITEKTLPYDKEFLHDLAKLMLEHKNDRNLPSAVRRNLDSGVPCAYHKHDKDKLCVGGHAKDFRRSRADGGWFEIAATEFIEGA